MLRFAHPKSRAAEYLAAIEGAVWLVVADALLRIFPFSRLCREIGPGESCDAMPVADQALIQGARSAVGIARRRLPWTPGCLPSALAGALMCRLRGVSAPIALSVTSKQGRFVAHARLDARNDAELAVATPTGRTHLGRVRLAF